MSNKINKAFNLPSTSNEVNTNAFSSNDNYFIAPEKCKPKQIPFKMECINKFDLLCSIYTGETFSDYGIKTGDSGNVVLEKIIQNLNKDEEDIPTVTKTSDLVNDGEDGVSPYTTENHVSINYLRYDRANTVVSNRFNIHSDYGNHSGFNFDYDYPQMFYGTNYLRMTDDSFLDIRVGAGVDINAPYLSVNGEIYASAHVASSLFKFTNATTGAVTAPRTLHTDGTNVKYTGNDGVPRDLAFASDIKTGIFNPPTLAQLTALNIKRGDFYKDINTGQIALFDGEQLTEWIITSVTQWNSLTPEQKAAVKIFSYQKDE